MGENKRGRPSKYDPSYCDLVLDTVGTKGKSVTQFARDLRVNRSTIYEWQNQHPDFSDALSRAKEWSEATWMDRLEGMMMTRDVNAPLVKLYLANRFGWHDKPEEERARPEEWARAAVIALKAMDGTVPADG